MNLKNYNDVKIFPIVSFILDKPIALIIPKKINPIEKKRTGENNGKGPRKSDKIWNNEFLFNVINEAFLEKWKPLIDQGIINHKVIEE